MTSQVVIQVDRDSVLSWKSAQALDCCNDIYHEVSNQGVQVNNIEMGNGVMIINQTHLSPCLKGYAIW